MAQLLCGYLGRSGSLMVSGYLVLAGPQVLPGCLSFLSGGQIESGTEPLGISLWSRGLATCGRWLKLAPGDVTRIVEWWRRWDLAGGSVFH